MNKIIISGTGHRPDKLWGYNLNHPMYTRLRSGLVNYFISLCKQYEIVEIVSGMALGFDTVLAQSAIIAKEQGYNIQLHCAIPCRNHSSKWQPDSIAEWNRIISLSDSQHINDIPYNNSCMQQRNIYMVDRCNILVALWNGTSGGTKNCVDYAKSKNKQIVYLSESN